MNRLDTVLRNTRPSLAAVVGSPLSSTALESLAVTADVVEMRADLFPSQDIDYLRDQAQRLGRSPLLLTIRTEAEGGAWVGPPQERLELFEGLIDLVDGVDVEAASTDIAPEVIDAARRVGKISIVSRHDFSDTKPVQDLVRTYDRDDYNTDYLKLASKVDTLTHYKRLMEFTTRCGTNGNLITVGMGAYGPLSRIALPALGSCLTYAFVGDEAIAPGQMSVQKTRGLIDQLYPE